MVGVAGVTGGGAGVTGSGAGVDAPITGGEHALWLYPPGEVHSQLRVQPEPVVGAMWL